MTTNIERNVELKVDDALLEFFKGLADSIRLRIAGQLAAHEASAEALVAALGEKLPVVLHHLARLQSAGLVEGPTSTARTYRLRLDAIHALAGRVLSRPQTVVPDDASQDSFDRKVLKDYLTPEGAFKDLPWQPRKFMVLLRFVFRDFEAERRYTEKEVNDLLGRYHEDSARLRRALVDMGWMDREANGGAYWRVLKE